MPLNPMYLQQLLAEHVMCILFFQEHRDLEARIAQIIKSTEEAVQKPAPKYVPPPRKSSHKYSTHTRPYNENEEDVMDDDELHNLLGV